MTMREQVAAALPQHAGPVWPLLFEMASEIDKLRQEVTTLSARTGDHRRRPLAGDSGGYLARGGVNTEGI